MVASGYPPKKPLGGIPTIWSPSICIWEGIELIPIIWYTPKILTFPQNSFSHITSIWWAWAKWNCPYLAKGWWLRKKGGGREPFLQEFLDVVKYAYVLRYIYIYTGRTCINIFFRNVFNVLLPSKGRNQRGSWFSKLQLRRRCIQKYPKFLEKKPSKSMQIDETVKTNWHLPSAEANGKHLFFSSYAVHDVCPYQEFFAREHLDKIAGSLGFSQALTKIRIFLPRESLQKPLYTIYMAFRNQGQKCLSLWRKRKIFNYGHGSKIRCMFSVWTQVIHSKDPEIKLVAISRVASEPSWSGLGWPAGTDCTSTFSNSSKHTPCVNMDISSIRVYIVRIDVYICGRGLYV